MFASVESVDEIRELIDMKNECGSPYFILGGGNNVLFTSDYDGIIIHPAIPGIEVEDTSGENVVASAGAGVEWDSLVEWSVARGFCGIENLSHIPGRVGAVPVQNIGAYGSEASEVVDSVVAVNMDDGSERVFKNAECRFGYRSSIFKRELKNRYLVTKVFFRLSPGGNFNLGYGSLEAEVNRLGGATPANVRQAVINIRAGKLPDPAVLGNAGSFFKNPVIDSHKAGLLKERFPDMPVYIEGEGLAKLPAGWLIERCGWKGRRMGDAGVHEKQALVIVNYGKATGRQIVELSEEIKRSVCDRFGILLEPEVEVVGAI
jgi:UDP-N-acetylmuramate dehydrogenase